MWCNVDDKPLKLVDISHIVFVLTDLYELFVYSGWSSD